MWDFFAFCDRFVTYKVSIYKKPFLKQFGSRSRLLRAVLRFNIQVLQKRVGLPIVPEIKTTSTIPHTFLMGVF